MISKSGQPLMKPACSTAIDLSFSHGPAMAFKVDFADYEAERHQHQHPQGQLILALHGAVTCTAESGVWIVPPDCGLWVPGGVLHSNQVTPNARLTYLFVEPGAAELPAECCTLSVSPMLREMIHRLADLPERDGRDAHVGRLMRVMLDELALMPRERLELPVSDHPKIAVIAAALLADPSDRRTLGQWAEHVAVSERTLKRLMIQETGLSFGRWRRQLHLVIALRELAGGATVQQVAGDLGYESTTAFIVMFRKALGTTPSRYFADRLLRAGQA
ncbi:helix-turn-helix transcriptional regulator [Rhizobium pusense]|uniref:DNA-binding transcriptional regulator n=1 Tax=Agrobacterium genomosp. 2 str. CFBP 5494 TaxID=1183436 RepID=A0A9W5B437_9HYPH|nr:MULTISPECIES: helix-turn-helix transcriptional regulator [Rhizobium/Agrobacterium group]MDH0912782.1 helix-turn-helix transcriptional regulator [Agrobacterium pusense]MDH1099048.1 helix-turn-helix transcriptional regulator [Agrobacterium pusense]MDH1115595.1 helix-turn-helix transcriptional regulator [Agrobacterium pusense]MDH2197365.1 helix-turn-helix transcriptional regulator [Agrobacterium pusense]OJH55781.1 AraC family transcriptional regulator [Agrobacterium pusense]